jgi:hypothetical protein
MPTSKKPTKKQLNKEIEDIRLTATSPYDLIKKLQEFWLKYGIKVTFDSYPCTFSLGVSNSHNSPKGYSTNWCGCRDKDNIPRGYPGWQGRWEGTVEILDTCTITKKGLYFSGLLGSWSDSLMDVWYIQTGSGGGGDRFQYDGMLWLYDFPKMHEEFELRGGRVEILKEDYTILLKRYYTQYTQEKEKFSRTNPVMMQCDQFLDTLESLKSTLTASKNQLHEHLTQKFNKQHAKKMPEINSAFDVSQTRLKEIYVAVNNQKTTTHPELQGIFETIENRTKEITDYLDEHPEFLF